MGYDQLNRLKRKTYGGSAPDAVYCYDGQTPSSGVCTTGTYASGPVIGKLTGVSNGISTTLFDYDSFGFLWLPDELPWFIDGFRVFPDQPQIQELINSVPTGNKGSLQGVGDVPSSPHISY
jgi:hypothetical protein